VITEIMYCVVPVRYDTVVSTKVFFHREKKIWSTVGQKIWYEHDFEDLLAASS